LQEDGSIVCISRDITERRRGDAERARLREELQLAQRREVIGQLAAGLAHDFNNILAVISGSAGLLESRLAAQQADTQESTRILQAASRAAKLVAKLRDLGKQGSVRQQLDLRKPLYEAADLLRAGLSGVHSLVVNAPQEPLEAMADPTDILQVLLNLGINARDALDHGPNEIAVTLASADPNQMQRPPDIGVLRDEVEYVMLRLEDTGPGIETEVRMRIFEPYYTSKGQRGTGLGLAIVAGVVRGNAAALWFDSTPGVGTRVTVFWPVAQEQATPTELAVSETRSRRLDGVQVLVVDDEEEICAVLAAVLEAAGAEVATTTDPRDAFDAITGDPTHWHVLITDHDMPHMTGSALAKSIHAEAPNLPVILVSALPDLANDDHQLFRAILQKPAEARQLVSMVAKAVDSSKHLKSE
jgi:nitrogen-specific signal transduction histidine kinase/ActR/RegA family two-component response regulator